jgi:hypothetical protein
MTLHSQLGELIDAMLPFVQQFHAKGQLAPHAASMNATGQITGSALVTEDHRTFCVPEALAHFESTFRRAAEAGNIVASAVFFHGVGLGDPARPAQTSEEAQAIVALLEHRAGESVFLVTPYHMAQNGIQYQSGKVVPKPASVFLGAQAPAKPWWRIW